MDAIGNCRRKFPTADATQGVGERRARAQPPERLPCQDLPQFRVEPLDQDEPAPTQKAEVWLQEAEEFLRHHMEGDKRARVQAPLRDQKVERVMGLHWMVAIDQQLRFFTAQGL